jgi:cholesterol oxidase
MSGYLGEGVEDFEEGEKKGQEQGSTLSFDVTIKIESVSDFIKLSGQEAKMSGTVSYKPLGQNLPIHEGVFTLFKPDETSGTRQMTYSFWFTGNDGIDYSLYGYKVIHDDPGIDVLEDMTRLFTRIYKGRRINGTPIGSGILVFHSRLRIPFPLSRKFAPYLLLLSSVMVQSVTRIFGPLFIIPDMKI